jgi:hypothetical protein
MGAGVGNRTPVLIVCSPQARVGRTLVARLLLDFFLMGDRPATGFDFVVEPPSFVDFLPDHTVQSDVADVEGQMALFDRLIEPDGTAKVVDLAPGSFRQFFSVMAQIDFADQALQRGIEPIALFMAAPDMVSHRAYAELQRSLPELLLVPVYNDAIAHGRRERENFPPAGPVAVPIQIPALAPHFYRFIENPPFSFAAFRSTPPRDIPLDAYMELLRWVRRVFVEFRELELRLLLGEVRASLLRGAS